MLIDLVDRIGVSLGKKLRDYPRVKSFFRTFWNPARNAVMELELIYRKHKIGLDTNLDKIHWVNPGKIKYGIKNPSIHPLKDEPNFQAAVGKVVGGDWDQPQNLKRFEERTDFCGLYERFIEGKKWEETEYYGREIPKFQNREVVRNCKDVHEFKKHRLEYLDRLFESIKNEGYKPHWELSEEDLWSDGVGASGSEVGIAIGRDGQLTCVDGRHRLAIAKILDIKEIPAKILVRHPEWVEFKKELLSYTDGETYHPLTHVDLRDIPSGAGHERFEIIDRNLSVEKGDLLDIGANFGYFCHKFEDKGFQCYAIEKFKKVAYFLERLRDAEGKEFKIFNVDVLEYDDKFDFDVVLALNIFHHLIREKHNFEKFVDFLGRLEFEELFFQAHRPEQPIMKNSYRNFTPEEWVECILEHSEAEDYELLGEVSGRKLFKFS